MKMKNILILLIYLAISQSLLGNDIDVKALGASGKKSEKVTEIVQKAIDNCWESGGGEVIFPPGDYTIGTIVLKSNVTLNLKAGATIWASLEEKDYENDFIIYKKNDSGKKGDGATPVLIYAKDAKNIGIIGKGNVNGQARRTYEDLKGVDGFIAEETENARKSGIEMKMYYKVKPYTCMLFLENCSNITLRDASFIESTDWTLHFKWCRQIFINSITVLSSLEKGVNADGIDIDGCQDVVVSDCIIKTGDDAIVLKTTQTFGESRPCENVTVTNCVLVSSSTALKLGTESFADFRFINFSNCIIRNTNRAMGIIVRDGALVENVTFSSIVVQCNRKHFNWWGNGDAIWLVVKKRSADSKIGTIKNIHFNNITATVQGTSKLEGFEGKPLQNIYFNNVNITLEAEDLKDKRADDIFFAQNVDGLNLNQLRLNWDISKGIETGWQHGLSLKEVSNLETNQLFLMPTPEKRECPLILFDKVNNAFIDRIFTTEEVNNPIEIKANCKGIELEKD